MQVKKRRLEVMEQNTDAWNAAEPISLVNYNIGASLVIQLLKLYTPNVRGWGRSLVRELDPKRHDYRSCMPQWKLKILCAATKAK